MTSSPHSAPFFRFKQGVFIDTYLSQRFAYETSKAVVLTRIADERSKTITLTTMMHEKLPPGDGNIVREISNTLSLLLHEAYAHSIKYGISFEDIEAVKEQLTVSANRVTYLASHPPKKHLWIELTSPIVYNAQRNVSGVFFYKLDTEYQRWVTAHGTKTVSIPAIERLHQDEGRWTLEVIDTQGLPLLSVKYYASSNQWEFSYPHICPAGKCKYTITTDEPTARYVELRPCADCRSAFTFWLSWFCSTYTLLYDQNNVNSIEIHSGKAIQNRDASPYAEPLSTLQVQRPSATDANALLIDRYIEHSHKKPAYIEQAHKYLWMNSAWMMTEALRHTTDTIHLYLPTSSIYIELEQPRQLHQQQIAAFSFLENDQHQWTLSSIDNEGQVVWALVHERNSWTRPKNSVCPERRCITEETLSGTSYLLCKMCQERFTHYTTWIATALRMIAGDFQEKLEQREPEEVFERTTHIVRDENTGESKNVQTFHRYKIIRYYDASKYRGKEPQTKRGSWMSGRPIAENEYEINLDAVIYVQIQPRDYHRTYQHERYTHARGKTDHIEPGPRLQPMTIATFRQFRRMQKITRVFASSFDDQQEVNEQEYPVPRNPRQR